uniref:Uncharacterized protein n=1 Tax=Ciona intestinalis TaxID=7719 RepID=H2XTK9_CIOIN
MDELQQAGDVLGSAADASKALGGLSKSLPGMAKSGDGGSAEPETCSACNQKIITSQPEGGVDVAKAAETAGSVMDCCSKAFDCFGKANDMVSQVQQ